jgi:hypothetical protein
MFADQVEQMTCVLNPSLDGNTLTIAHADEEKGDDNDNAADETDEGIEDDDVEADNEFA